VSYVFRFHEKNSKEKTQPPHGLGRCIGCVGHHRKRGGNHDVNQSGVFMKRRQRNQFFIGLMVFGILSGAVELFALWYLIKGMCS